MAKPTFVIVGAGFAGAKAAESLRAEGFDGRLVLVGAEPERPYERPPLSKGYLAGSKPRESAFVHPADWYAEHSVELLTSTRAISLSPADHRVELSVGAPLVYDAILLATGAEPRRLGIPGADLAGVHYLRRMGEAEALIAEISPGGRSTVVIGGGWIGLEVAAAARGYGNEVTVVEPEPTLLRKALGDEIGPVFADLHRENGVTLRLGEEPSEITGSDGRVATVHLKSGDLLPADLVVVGIGAIPNTSLAADAGLTVDNGIVTDEYLRTSHPDVFAAGDVANSFHPLLGHHLRVEHWANAKDGGAAAGRLMLGRGEPYDPVPYFFTDQYDLGMEYSGAVGEDGYDRIVYRGDMGTREFVAFWLRDQRVVAGMNVNVWDVSDVIQEAIRSGLPVDPERLPDPAVPIAEAIGRG